MQGWEQFWKQVPGKGYREDFTPASFDVQTWLEPIDIRYLSEAFAEDLQDLLYSNHPFWVLELKDTLDRLMDQMEYDADEGSVKAARAEINYLMRHFRRFHAAKEKRNNP